MNTIQRAFEIVYASDLISFWHRDPHIAEELLGRIFVAGDIDGDHIRVRSGGSLNAFLMNTEAQLDEIRQRSTTRPQLIFKHSTRCSTSALVKGRLERAKPPESIDFYYLDLIGNRPISNYIAETFFVEHESPQVLLIRNGECVYDESHLGITMNDIVDAAA